MVQRRPSFVHLNVHSAYSFGAGPASIEQLAARASAEGHHALALTDTDGAYGLPTFQACCAAVDLHPIHGVELRGHPLIDQEPHAEHADPRLARVVLLAENDVGHTHLSRLITASHLRKHGGAELGPEAAFTLLDDLPPCADGLVILTPSPYLLRRLAEALGPASPTRPYLGAELIAHAPVNQQRALIEAARAVGCPIVGTHRVFLERASQHEVHRVRLAIAHLKFLREIVPDAPGRHGTPIDLLPPTAWLMSPDQAARAFRDIPEAARATLEIAERCTFRFERSAKPRLPQLDAATLGLERTSNARERKEAAYGRLATLTIAGLHRRYEQLTPEAIGRLEKELRVIQLRGFSDYFLIVNEIVDFATSQDIPVVGRGSAASSIVAYALGITSVDPLRYELPFERFLSPEREDCPDIDLDLDWRDRDRVIQHVYDTYGDERVAMISTHVSFQARGAVRDIARTHGMAPDEIARVTAHLPYHLRASAIEQSLPPELADVDLDAPPWRDILHAARSLDGLPRHLGIHVGGIVIGDGPLPDSLPLERSAMGRIITQYDMHGVEATGLVKIDLLGNRALAVIADVRRDVEARTGSVIDLDRVPEDDPAAGDLLRRGHTFGCFQVESPGMRNLVVRLEAKTQQDAMIALSLIRPGPAGSGMKGAYVRRRRGEERTPSVHPLVDPLFANTHGVMLYQEDTMRVAAAVAGFDLAHADRLRRALSKKRLPEDLPAMEAAFRQGGAVRGVPPATIEQVWQAIRQFSAYAYNKAHAATYSRISWQGLYLQARYPAAYLASVIRNGAGFYAPRVYVESARRLGCTIRLPCINTSQQGPCGWDRSLHLGLDQIKGLGKGVASHLLEVREAGGLFVSLTDLLLRTRLERAQTERLVLAGALDLFDRPRGELLWMLTLDFERYVAARRDKQERTSLFGPTAMLPPQRNLPVPPTYTTEELLQMEVEALGLTVTCHPFAPWADLAERAGAIPTVELIHHIGRRVTIAGWVVSDRRVRIRPKGGTRRREPTAPRYMKFLMVEDPHGTVEVTLFPRTYAQVGHHLRDAGPFLIRGRVQDDHGALTLDAQEVERLQAE